MMKTEPRSGVRAAAKKERPGARIGPEKERFGGTGPENTGLAGSGRKRRGPAGPGLQSTSRRER